MSKLNSNKTETKVLTRERLIRERKPYWTDGRAWPLIKKVYSGIWIEEVRKVRQKTLLPFFLSTGGYQKDEITFRQGVAAVARKAKSRRANV